MHGRLAIALLALPLLVPARRARRSRPGRDIRKLDAFTASAGALVRVTLRAPLEGRISVRFERRDGVKPGASAVPRSSAGASASTSSSPATPARCGA